MWVSTSIISRKERYVVFVVYGEWSHADFHNCNPLGQLALIERDLRVKLTQVCYASATTMRVTRLNILPFKSVEIRWLAFLSYYYIKSILIEALYLWDVIQDTLCSSVLSNVDKADECHVERNTCDAKLLSCTNWHFT